MSRKQYLIITLAAAVMAFMMWKIAYADVQVKPQAAETQVRQIVPTLGDSEAEHVSGAYIPGVGAVIIMDLLRGPNSVPGKTSYGGTRDWAIYLMQTFGPKLSAVPADESISLSVDFYDYKVAQFRQMVITTLASDVADAGKYKVWLDDQLYNDAVAQDPASAVQPEAPATTKSQSTPEPSVAEQPTAKPQATGKAGGSVSATAVSTVIGVAPGKSATPKNQPQATPKAAATPQSSGVANPTPFPATMSWDFADPAMAKDQWIPVSGKWVMTGTAYEQTALS